MTARAPLTAALLADALGTDARTARKFLRSITPKDAQPGKGSRWEIKATKTELTALAKKFAKFTAEQDAAKAKRDEATATPAEEAPPVNPLDDDENPLVDEDTEPTDAELEAIDA